MNYKLCTIISFLSVPLVFAHGEATDEPDIVHAMKSAKTPDERLSARQRIFSDISEEAMQELVVHENDDVAMTAAWERVVRDKIVETQEGMPELGRKLPIEGVERFFGYIEGRLRVIVPEEWADAVRQGVIFKNGSVVPKLCSLRKLFHKDEDGYILLNSQSIEQENGKQFLKINNERYEIPELVFGKERAVVGVYGVATNNVCVQYFPEQIGPSQIICVGQENGQLKWRAEVWRSRSGGGISGVPAEHLALLVIHRAVVYVFGADGGGAIYLEAFRISNGEPVLRFSTAY